MSPSTARASSALKDDRVCKHSVVRNGGGAGGGAQYKSLQNMYKALCPIPSIETQGETVVSSLGVTTALGFIDEVSRRSDIYITA